jgi:CheY-like chemotaxis protein
VIINLLNNAAKYTPPGGRITLSVTTQEDRMMLKIQDNGVGISQAMLPRLFDLFLQVDSSAKYAQGGLGVGLPLVRRLIEMHGGTVAASSAGLDKGSVFAIELPLAPLDDSRPAAEAEPPKRLASGSLKILMVDDNVDSAESLAALLRISGHEVFLTHNGEAAITLAAQLKPDVIVLDIGLPGISGYETARVLRRDDAYHPLLIAITGWGSEDDRRLALDAGFDEHLVKPVNIKRLNELLQMTGHHSEQTPIASAMPVGEWS